MDSDYDCHNIFMELKPHWDTYELWSYGLKKKINEN